MRARDTPAKPGEFDFVVAMTHDHGLIPVKYLGVEQGVNVTLGLPFVRTSPDHGTAFDIAGPRHRRPGQPGRGGADGAAARAMKKGGSPSGSPALSVESRALPARRAATHFFSESRISRSSIDVFRRRRGRRHGRRRFLLDAC